MRILLDKFTKKFGNLTVIDEMDLEVHDGEMIALLGGSGCGNQPPCLPFVAFIR